MENNFTGIFLECGQREVIFNYKNKQRHIRKGREKESNAVKGTIKSETPFFFHLN
jgi:hypothetical protein